MTKQEKQLLLVDLCARLPYGVKIKYLPDDRLNGIVLPYLCNGRTVLQKGVIKYRADIKSIRPYLRPMSSMTEEEREHLQTLHNIISDENYGDGFSPAAWEAILDFNNYCREHHLDNGGLITLGLALEAPEGMYK